MSYNPQHEKHPAPEETGLELYQFPLLESDRQERKAFAAAINQSIADGRTDPIKILVQIKNVGDIIDRLTNRKDHPETATPFMDAVMDHAEAYGSKPFYFGNASVQVREAGTRYDFAACNDPEWNEMNQQMQELKARMKEREEFLKNLPAAGKPLICEGGEIVEVARAAKRGTPTVFVTIN